MVSIEIKDKYDIYDLFELVKILRSEDGCPWDKVQTHKSIRNDFLEETCEAMEAIDQDNPDMLKEELGDVLWQVCFHCQLEVEQNHFNFDDVCTEVCKKLILRHPHVFGNIKVNNTDDVLKNWDEIKKDEKHQVTYTDTLNAVAKTFPSLMRAQKVGKRAMRAGMDFENVESALNSLELEISELKKAISLNDTENISEELGDVLFSCTNVARKLSLDSERCLNDSTEKFINRFSEVEKIIMSQGKNMNECSPKELDEVWNKIKSNSSKK